jgi:hypothetical protein
MKLNLNEGSQWLRFAPTFYWAKDMFRIAVWIPFIGYVGLHKLPSKPWRIDTTPKSK